MALGETLLESWPGEGNKTWYRGYWTFDSSYPTGGEARPVTPGIERIGTLICAGGGTAASGLGYDFELIKSSQFVVVTWANAGTAGVLLEVTDTTSLAALTAVPFLALSD